MNYRHIKFFTFVIAFFLIRFISFAQENDRGYIVTVGQVAPDFKLTTTDGKTFSLSEKKGKVVMLQFTASWCSVCRKEMPHIESEIWRPLKEKGLELIGIDRDEPANVVTEFASKMQITYPLAPDPKAQVFSLYAAKEAGVTRNVIIDKDGKIAFLTRLYDDQEFNSMKDAINTLLK